MVNWTKLLSWQLHKTYISWNNVLKWFIYGESVIFSPQHLASTNVRRSGVVSMAGLPFAKEQNPPKGCLPAVAPWASQKPAIEAGKLWTMFSVPERTRKGRSQNTTPSARALGLGSLPAWKSLSSAFFSSGSSYCLSPCVMVGKTGLPRGIRRTRSLYIIISNGSSCYPTERCLTWNDWQASAAGQNSNH